MARPSPSKVDSGIQALMPTTDLPAYPFPLTGDYIWEFIERGGSYGAPLALMILARSAARMSQRGRLHPIMIDWSLTG